MTPTQKAREAGTFAQDLAFRLLAASTPGTSHADIRKHLAKAFQIWPSLTKRMAELADLAPNCASEGQQQADRIKDIAERSETPSTLTHQPT